MQFYIKPMVSAVGFSFAGRAAAGGGLCLVWI